MSVGWNLQKGEESTSMLSDTAGILRERITIVADLVELTVKSHFRNRAHTASTRVWRLGAALFCLVHTEMCRPRIDSLRVRVMGCHSCRWRTTRGSGWPPVVLQREGVEKETGVHRRQLLGSDPPESSRTNYKQGHKCLQRAAYTADLCAKPCQKPC